MQTDTDLLHTQLVEEIRRYVQNETILNAFRRIPRHEFVSSFYNKITSNNRRTWQYVPYSLEDIYTNRPLTISLDQYGNPNSSSSQPDLMAQMIQSVELQPGHRVLEIGTGTGYNAAILACIVGPENVVSLDINHDLVAMAQLRIGRTVGHGVTVLQVDGRHLPIGLGLFNAIIVTGSHERIEPSWISALAPGGRIVFNWMTSLVNVMIEAEKTGNGLIGCVCQYDGEFMHLHDGGGVEYPHLLPEPLPLLNACLDFRSQIIDPDFSFFLQMNSASLKKHIYQNKQHEQSFALHDGKTNRVIHFFPGSIRGDASLWDDIKSIYEKFKLRQPRHHAFSLTVDDSGVMTFHYQDEVFLVPVILQ